jgi:hypothetical protein
VKTPAVCAAGSEKVQLVLENRRREATRLASQITAHSGFSPRSLSHIGIENIAGMVTPRERVCQINRCYESGTKGP